MGKTHVVSFSELDSYRQCPFKHDLAYKQRWVSEEVSPALSKGILWHEVLAAHYQTIMAHKGPVNDPELAQPLFDATAPLLYGDDGDKQTDTQELIEWMYRGYVAQWGIDTDWRIRAVEHSMEMWLPTPTGGRSNYKLKVKIDLVVQIRLQGKWRLWLVDHKSGRDLPKDKELDLDDQFGLYTWAMRHAGHDVFGVIYNAARTQRNVDDSLVKQPLDTRFKRHMMHRNDHELDLLAVEAYRSARAAYQWKEGEAPRHVNTELCRWRCSFTEPCLAGRRGVDIGDFLRQAGFRQDPTRH